MAGTGGDGGQHGGGHGKHEGAGAEHHEQRHRPIEWGGLTDAVGGGELQVQEEEGGGGEREDRVGVAPLIDGTLGWRLAVLGFTDQAYDALQGAVSFRPGDFDNQTAPGVERTPSDVGSSLFRGGFCFASEVGLIHGALAGEDFTVRRYQLARQDGDAVAGEEGGHGHLGFGVIWTQSAGMLRRLVEEGVDGAARAVHRVMFDGAGGRKEKKKEGSLPLGADNPRANRHDDHQEVNVDAPLP